MKGYKRFIIAFSVVLTLYIVAELNRPKPVDWKISLSKEDKNPFGGYIIYHELKDLFPRASINSYRLPVYNQVNNARESNTAYILIGPQLDMSPEDVKELLDYVVAGNFVFISSGYFSKTLLDTLKFATMRRFDLVNRDSITINFTNPLLRSEKNYGFKRMTVDGYLNKFDTANVVALGNNQLNDINFIKFPYGDGAFFIHALPLCFSNYFMVTGKNSEYAAKALSYLPSNIVKIFWDEYYKMGPAGSQNPLRFILNDPYLRWAFRIALLAMLLLILFEMKRKQRVIPIIAPLQNSTLEFVQTVGNVYYNQRDNKNIALKKINYFLEYIRSNYFLSTSELDQEFVVALSKKSDQSEEEIKELIRLIDLVNESSDVSDHTILELSSRIDSFYKPGA